jgi:phosphoglycolate phosphatase
VTRTILFDLDGTLVDSRQAIARSLRHTLERHGLASPPDPVLHRHIGPPLEEALVQLLELLGADPGRAPELLVTYRERYGRLCVEETPLFPGIAGLLERLAGQARLAVVTSKPRPFAVPILEGRGVARHFAHIEGPTLEARSEAKHVTFGRALLTLGIDQAVMIGDRHHDVMAARAHGVPTIGVLWGIGGRAELEEAGADAIVESVDELGELLSRSGTTSR